MWLLKTHTLKCFPSHKNTSQSLRLTQRKYTTHFSLKPLFRRNSISWNLQKSSFELVFALRMDKNDIFQLWNNFHTNLTSPSCQLNRELERERVAAFGWGIAAGWSGLQPVSVLVGWIVCQSRTRRPCGGVGWRVGFSATRSVKSVSCASISNKHRQSVVAPIDLGSLLQ